MNVTRRSRRCDSRAHCGDETSEKGASRAAVAAARRNGVGDAIFGHGVASRAPSARTPATVHDFRALALEREWWGGLGIRESFVTGVTTHDDERRDNANTQPTTTRPCVEENRAKRRTKRLASSAALVADLAPFPIPEGAEDSAFLR